jgi:hypothetical protein
MSGIKHWAWVNRDIPYYYGAGFAYLLACLQIRCAMTKVLQKLKGDPEILNRLGIPGT